jgi:hypothetical protein
MKYKKISKVSIFALMTVLEKYDSPIRSVDDEAWVGCGRPVDLIIDELRWNSVMYFKDKIEAWN